jgi:hypothetical protein
LFHHDLHHLQKVPETSAATDMDTNQDQCNSANMFMAVLEHKNKKLKVPLFKAWLLQNTPNHEEE